MADPTLDAFDAARGPAVPPPLTAPRTAEEATFDLARGVYADSARPAEQRAAGLVKAAALAGKGHEEFDALVQQHVPEADPGLAHQEFGLEQARSKFRGKEESAENYIGRHMTPGVSSGRALGWQLRVNNAQEAYQNGEASPGDLDTLAEDEWQREKNRQYLKENGFLGAAAHTAAGILPIAGEIAAGPGGRLLKLTAGANPSLLRRAAAAAAILPATVPSISPLQGAAQRAGEQGGGTLDFKNLAPAAGESMLKAAVLGSVTHYFRSVEGLVPRASMQGLVGAVEMTAADGIAGGLGLTKRGGKASYGEVIDDILAGKVGEANRSFALNWIAFTAFAAAHGQAPPERAKPGTSLAPGRAGPPPEGAEAAGPTPTSGPRQPSSPILGRFQDAIDWMKGQGFDTAKQAAVMSSIRGRLERAVGENPDLTRAEAESLFANTRGSPLWDFTQELAKVFPETAPTPPGPKVRQTGATPNQPQPPGTPPGELLGGQPTLTRPRPLPPAPNAPEATPGAKPTVAPPGEPATGTGSVTTPAVPTEPRARLQHFEGLRDASDQRVADAERASRAAGEQANILHATAASKSAATAARLELMAARRERKGIQTELDAARDEVMKLPESGRSEIPNVEPVGRNVAPPAPVEAPTEKAPGSPQVAPEPPVAQTTAQPGIVHPAQSQAANGRVQIGATRETRTIADERMVHHEILGADGKSLGEVRVIPRGDTLHVEHFGLTGAAIGERAGDLGSPAASAVVRQLVAAYPDAVYVTGLRTSGARAGKDKDKQRTRLKIPGREPSPVEPIEDVFARLGANPAPPTAPAGGSTTAAPLTLQQRLAAMRARQRPTAAPVNPTGLTPTVPRRATAEEKIDTLFEAAGLTPDHAAAVRKMLEVRSLRKAADELGVSHQTVANRIEAASKALLGDEKAKFLRGEIDRLADEYKLELVEDGHDVKPGDLHDPTGAARAGLVKLTRQESVRKELDTLADRWFKEINRGITPERDTEFRAEAARLAERLEAAHRGESPAVRPAPGVPGEVARGNPPPRPGDEGAVVNQAAPGQSAVGGAGGADPAAGPPAAAGRGPAAGGVGRNVAPPPAGDVTADLDASRKAMVKEGFAESDLRLWEREVVRSLDGYEETNPASRKSMENDAHAMINRLSEAMELDTQLLLYDHLRLALAARIAPPAAGGVVSGNPITRRQGDLLDRLAAGNEGGNTFQSLGEGRYMKVQGRHVIMGTAGKFDEVIVTFKDGGAVLATKMHPPDVAEYAASLARVIDTLHARGIEISIGARPQGKWAEVERILRDEHGISITDKGQVRPFRDVITQPAADISVPAGQEPGVRRFGGGPRGGRSGAISLEPAAIALRAAHDEWAKLRGEQFPATNRESGPVADHMAALVAARAYAEAVTEVVMDQVFKGLLPAARAKFYTAHLESRLAYMRSKGANAVTLIGPDSPVKTFQEYARIVASPAFARYLQRWKAVEVPIMNKHYWASQGLPPGSPIPTATQLPDHPINLVRVRQDGSPTAVGGGGQRVHPERVHQRRLGFNRKATGESPFGYETDPRKALLAAHEQGAMAAGRANLDRQIVDAGQGQWGRPGQPRPAMPDGTPMAAVRDVTPEQGTQVAKPRETTLYVNPKILDDYHNAIDLGQSFRVPVLTPTLQVMTKVAIASTVEAAYHSANLLNGLGKPYVLRNLVREVWDFAKPLLKRELPHFTSGQIERFAGLAEHGMTKPRGFQAGLLVSERLAEKYPVLGKLDPTNWARAFLDTVDQITRLAMDRAFARMAKDGLVPNTIKNKRDFLNTLGQYKTQAQAMVVRILRGTGIGPFATAATNSPVQAIRSLWASPGVEATSPTVQARLRMHVFLKMAAAVGAAGLVNWLVWGRPDGDETIPFGAMKLGESKGRSYYADPLRFMGPRRGLNVTGANALVEGHRLGASPQAILHKARMEVQHGLLHPAAGPGTQFGWTLATGENALGTNLAGKPAPGGTVEWENFKAAVKNANPTLAALMTADRVKPGEAMPLFPLFGREVPGKPGGLVGQYPEERPFEAGAGKLLAPYVGSRKQLPLDVQRGLMEKEALPKRK